MRWKWLSDSSDTVECVVRESESLTFCPSGESAEYLTSSKLTQEAGICSTRFSLKHSLQVIFTLIDDVVFSQRPLSVLLDCDPYLEYVWGKNSYVGQMGFFCFVFWAASGTKTHLMPSFFLFLGQHICQWHSWAKVAQIKTQCVCCLFESAASFCI